MSSENGVMFWIRMVAKNQLYIPSCDLSFSLIPTISFLQLPQPNTTSQSWTSQYHADPNSRSKSLSTSSQTFHRCLDCPGSGGTLRIPPNQTLAARRRSSQWRSTRSYITTCRQASLTIFAPTARMCCVSALPCLKCCGLSRARAIRWRWAAPKPIFLSTLTKHRSLLGFAAWE